MNPKTKEKLLEIFRSLEKSLARSTKYVNDDWLPTDIKDIPMVATDLQSAASEIILLSTRYRQ